MRLSTPVFRAGLLLAAGIVACGPVQAAGDIDSGTEIRVNSASVGRGVLLYPDGQYMRVVRPLLMPGQTNAPVSLHMPRPRPRVVARPRPAASEQVAAAPAPAPQRQAAPAPQRQAAAQPAPYSGFGAASPNLYNQLATQPAQPAAKPPVQMARATPPAPTTTTSATADAGASKTHVILFAKDATEPAEGALGAIKFLAGDLNTQMIRPASRVQLLAYGGAPGDKGSEARRLSLKRALALRQLLIDDGVPSSRIDVRAMGGADDNGPTDRVDVYVKA